MQCDNMQCENIHYDYQIVIRVPASLYDKIKNDAVAKEIKKSEIIRSILTNHYMVQ